MSRSVFQTDTFSTALPDPLTHTPSFACVHICVTYSNACMCVGMGHTKWTVTLVVGLLCY